MGFQKTQEIRRDNETTRQRDNETTRQRDDETTRRRDNETKRHLMVSNKKAKTSDSFRGGRLVVLLSCCLVVSLSRCLVVSSSRRLVVSSSLGLAQIMSKKMVSKNSKSTVWILDPHDTGSCQPSLLRFVFHLLLMF